MMEAEVQGEPDGTREVLDRELVNSVLDAVEANDAEQVSELLEPLHAADVADLIEQIGASDRQALVEVWGENIDGDSSSGPENATSEPHRKSLSPEMLAEAIKDLDSDDVVDLVEDLEEEQQVRILGALEAVDRIGVESSLSYPEYSAGRLMQRELVALPEDWTVGQAIDFVRSTEDLPDQFYHVILVSPSMKPAGYVALGRLLSSRRDHKLIDIVEASFRTVTVTDEESEVAYLFNHYHLISAPVIDEDGRLVGVITIDDAMAVLDEEHEEDMLRMAGVDEDSSLADSVLQTTKGRAVWLLVNLVTAIVASLVIDMYAETINQMVALAVLMPIVASMGGNAGTQTMTVAVRAIAARTDREQRVARKLEGNHGGCDKWPGLRPADGAGGRFLVRRPDAGRGHRRGHATDLDRGRAGRHPDPDRTGQAQYRPGAGLGAVRHHRDRRDRLLRVPRPGLGRAAMKRPGGDTPTIVPAAGRWSAKAQKRPRTRCRSSGTAATAARSPATAAAPAAPAASSGRTGCTSRLRSTAFS